MTTDQLLVAAVVLLSLLLVVAIGLFILLLRTTNIEGAVSRTWRNLGLDETVGSIKTHADEIKKSYRDFELMLRVPSERGAFGELSLETLLSDSLPEGAYGVRQKCLDGVIPDAHIISPIGTICIDSKFPLENYAKMLAQDDPDEKVQFKKRFISDLRGHLKKIADDYVCPEKGSAQFAFAYLASEGVYYFLACEAADVLREFTGRGVQVASPLTLAHKLEVLKAGIRAMKLNDDAQEVLQSLGALGKRFEAIDEVWQVFSTHVRNMSSKAVGIDREYQKLREEFGRISKGM